MVRPFALVLKCYGGFVLVADHPPSESPTRLWPINSECGAVGHGSIPAIFDVGRAVLGRVAGDEPIDVVFHRSSNLLTPYCTQNGVVQSVGFIFAGFDAERRQKLFGWMWDQNASTVQTFDPAVVHSFGNPIGNYLTAKLYSFDLTEELASKLGLYILMQSRVFLPYPMDEFAEIGWLRSSRGLEPKSVEYIRERLELLQHKSEELRFRCQQLLAKDQP